MSMKKVGIYAGTFDPIHTGHLAFARQALETCGLDKIFFLVEPRPRRKQGVRALEHREAMVRLATAKESRFGMIVLGQASFSVEQTLPKLKELFKGAKMHMLLGEDVLMNLNSWPNVEELLSSVSFIIGTRASDEAKLRQYLQTTENTRGIKFDTTFIVTEHQEVSSSKIRLSFKRGETPKGLPAELLSYIKENGLYGRTEF